MGQAKVKKTATQKFIELYPECCFCAGKRPSVEREHMPPKSLFDNSHRPDKLVMPSCKECNSGSSTSDLVAAILSRWGENSLLNDHARLSSRAWKQAPEVMREWTENIDRIQVRGKRHLRKSGVMVPLGASVVSIGEKTIRELNLFSHKVTLALYFEHFKKPLPLGGTFCAFWRTKEDYLANGLPSMLLSMLPIYGTLIQGRWNESKTFEYRHDLNLEDGLFGYLAKVRNGLFISGFAVADRKQLTPTDNAEDWMEAGLFLELRDTSRFGKKL